MIDSLAAALEPFHNDFSLSNRYYLTTVDIPSFSSRWFELAGVLLVLSIFVWMVWGVISYITGRTKRDQPVEPSLYAPGRAPSVRARPVQSKYAGWQYPAAILAVIVIGSYVKESRCPSLYTVIDPSSHTVKTNTRSLFFFEQPGKNILMSEVTEFGVRYIPIWHEIFGEVQPPILTFFHMLRHAPLGAPKPPEGRYESTPTYKAILYARTNGQRVIIGSTEKADSNTVKTTAREALRQLEHLRVAH